MAKKKEEAPLPDIRMVERTTLPTDQIKPNEWNPNLQDAEIYRVLAQSLKEEGFGEPILVRRVEGKIPYEVVNGEHRWRLAVETGMTHVPAAIVDMDKHNAMLATIRRNRTRGGLDTIKTAKILNDMRKRLSDEEIEQRLGFSQQELDEMVAMIDAPFVPFGGGRSAPEIYELNVDRDTSLWLDTVLLGLAGKRATRFEGRPARKARGLAKAIEFVKESE